MSKMSDKITVDLSKGFPNVLLLGNGILKTCAGIEGITPKGWSECISELSDNNKALSTEIPYSISATVLAPVNDKERQDKYIEVFNTLEFKNAELLNKLVNLGFDSVLTTNYTYEIENAFHEGFSNIKSKNQCRFSKSTVEKENGRFLLHTYNQFENSPPIWHIHGELRRKTSLVLTHDEYSRMISHLITENAFNKNKYVKYKESVEYRSWLDYFLMSNLYIFGLGMDFSEFDLWWILNRRMRENAQVGKVIFFRSKDDNQRVCEALDSMKVDVKTFDDIDSNREDYYEVFTRKAVDYIRNDLALLEGEK